jgi:hypothetical protein
MVGGGFGDEVVILIKFLHGQTLNFIEFLIALKKMIRNTLLPHH